MDVDVLVVGAGPTGLMLANQLARRGVRVTIVDRHSGPAQQTRAMAVQARTLELYAWLGLADRALELGRKGNGATVVERRARRAHPDRRRRPRLRPCRSCSSWADDNERILGERLRDSATGAMEHRARRARAIGRSRHRDAQAARRVDAEPLGPCVGGCDGAHSTVRICPPSSLPVRRTSSVLRRRHRVHRAMVPDELNIYLWRDGFHPSFDARRRPLARDRHPPRIAARLRAGDVRRGGPDIVREVGAKLHFKSCSWFSTYRIHHRSASTSATGAASCSATRRTSTVPRARRA